MKPGSKRQVFVATAVTGRFISSSFFFFFSSFFLFSFSGTTPALFVCICVELGST